MHIYHTSKTQMPCLLCSKNQAQLADGYSGSWGKLGVVCCSQLLQVWEGRRSFCLEGCRNSVAASGMWDVTIRGGKSWQLGWDLGPQQDHAAGVGQIKLTSHEVFKCWAWCAGGREKHESPRHSPGRPGGSGASGGRLRARLAHPSSSGYPASGHRPCLSFLIHGRGWWCWRKDRNTKAVENA